MRSEGGRAGSNYYSLRQLFAKAAIAASLVGS
jgi:hypothetical protein